MEKVVVAISLSAIFKPKLKKIQTMTDQSDRIFVYHNAKEVFDKGPLFSFIEQLLCANLSFVDVMIISDSPPEISDCIFESLAYYKLEIDNVILSNRTSILDYLAALKVDLFFSSDLNLVQETQKMNILAGLVSLGVTTTHEFKVALDHRLFAKEGMCDAFGKILPVFGFWQKLFANFKVALLTTRCYSVESWVKDLFKLSQCKVNEVCFLGMGGTEDVCRLFDLTVYIEGERQDSLIRTKPTPRILNIDF